MASLNSQIQLNERAETLLQLLIRRYIDEGEPVGSRTLSREPGLELSPATIRNVMADLEELGLIRSPHTSAGRVPTQLGYRVFVDTMMKVKPLNNAAIEEISGGFAGARDPNELIELASELVSQITHFAGVVMLPGERRSQFRQIEFLQLADDRILAILVTDDGRVQNRVLFTDRGYSASELVEAGNFFNAQYAGKPLNEVRHALLHDMERDSNRMNQIMRRAVDMAKSLFEDDESNSVVITGETNLMGVPDFGELEKLREIFDTFKTKQDLLELLDKSMNARGVSIFIGEESGYNALTDCSVVTAPYLDQGRCVGVLGVVGPTRMAYDEVIPVVDITARFLGNALSSLH
jgi:heat-inducible transcriptional repressor